MYTVPGLMGHRGGLWQWGEWLADGGASRQQEERDSMAVLGMQPQHGGYGSRLPVDVVVLDVARGVDFVLKYRRGGELDWWILFLYYSRGLGRRFSGGGNGEVYREKVARFGVQGQTGDAAVARVLADVGPVRDSPHPEAFVYARRRGAATWIAQFLNGQRTIPPLDSLNSSNSLNSLNSSTRPPGVSAATLDKPPERVVSS